MKWILARLRNPCKPTWQSVMFGSMGTVIFLLSWWILNIYQYRYSYCGP